MSTVSIVIPTLNRLDLVERCLDSVEQQTHQERQVIVVDDGSDPPIDVGNRAEVVRLDQNSGFAKATNTGIRKAQGDWILLLNNDVTMEPDCIAQMIARGDETGAAMVAPLLLWDDQRNIIYSAGDRVRKDCRPEPIGFRQPLEGFQFPDFIFGVTGACGLFRRDIFDAVGLLDETFVAYFEDVDLCFRARLHGFEAALARDAVAYHIGSASQDGQTWWRSQQCWVNHALLIEKHLPNALRARHRKIIADEHHHQFSRMWSSARADLGTWRAIGVVWKQKLAVLKAMRQARAYRWQQRPPAAITPEQLDAWLSDVE